MSELPPDWPEPHASASADIEQIKLLTQGYSVPFSERTTLYMNPQTAYWLEHPDEWRRSLPWRTRLRFRLYDVLEALRLRQPD